MGTETLLRLALWTHLAVLEVKLNNPRMGTETTHPPHLIC